MNKRVYYLDSYTTQFNAFFANFSALRAEVVVVLDKTYFYPTSGGQPFDKGKINEVAVIDVLVRAQDGAVLHMLERELELLSLNV